MSNGKMEKMYNTDHELSHDLNHSIRFGMLNPIYTKA